MFWDREAYLSHLCFGDSPREMVVELFGPLIGTEDAWREAGATEAEIDLSAFAWDRADIRALPMDKGPLNGLEETVLKETESTRIVRDVFGRTMVLPKKVATIALPRDFPVQEPEDWDRIRHWFRTDESRLSRKDLLATRRERERGAVVRAYIWGAYDILRELMGDETACIALVEEPDWVRDILRTIGDMQADCLERTIGEVNIDVLFVHEDFAGKNGPLVGPQTIRQLFNPYYRRMWEIARRGGARIFDIDSDGHVEPVMDALLEGGINCLHPVEPAGGTDMVKLRKRYGHNLILRGGIDKHALTRGKGAIDAELAYRLDPVLRGGGTMFGLDHRIPSGVSIGAYRYYVERLREILSLPPAGMDEAGWCRMA